jgi:hypothetical protein
LAEEFCRWAKGKEPGFLQDEEGNTFLCCQPLKPYLADLAAERSPR